MTFEGNPCLLVESSMRFSADLRSWHSGCRSSLKKLPNLYRCLLPSFAVARKLPAVAALVSSIDWLKQKQHGCPTVAHSYTRAMFSKCMHPRKFRFQTLDKMSTAFGQCTEWVCQSKFFCIFSLRWKALSLPFITMAVISINSFLQLNRACLIALWQRILKNRNSLACHYGDINCDSELLLQLCLSV